MYTEDKAADRNREAGRRAAAGDNPVGPVDYAAVPEAVAMLRRARWANNPATVRFLPDKLRGPDRDAADRHKAADKHPAV